MIVARQRPLNPGKNLAITVYLDSNDGLQKREGIHSIIEFNDGTLLLDFVALMHTTVHTHIFQCKSFDGGDTWTELAPIKYGRQPSLVDFPVDERIQEPVVRLIAPSQGDACCTASASTAAACSIKTIYEFRVQPRAV